MSTASRRDERDRVRVFDTTLRDGEQSPGIALNKQEKLEIAQQLARLGVDIVEAGFPISSPGDFEAVQAIARAELEPAPPVICALARTSAQDIDAAWEAVRDSERPRIHTFIATSDIHIERKLQTTREDVKGQVRAAVAHARELCDDVEFSPEDGSRSDVSYMAEVIQIALDEGATTINVPDTVGYTMPEEYAAMFAELYRLVPGLRDVIVSVHCHDDLGLAVANSLAGVQAGCRQVECAINGIGERAGNASLEEIVMLLHTRKPALGLWTGVQTTEIARTSRLVSRLTGYPVQPNKAIVGRNAFAHEAGIHQDGVLKERATYEIMDATTVGLRSNAIVLGKHSGRHALRAALEEMGFKVDGQALNTAFKRFKEIADRKKLLTAMDLEALVADELRGSDEVATYAFVDFEVAASSAGPPMARVNISVADGASREEGAPSIAEATPEGTPPGAQAGRRTVKTGESSGDGPVDAIFKAINAATGVDAALREFRVDAVTEGQDALGEVSVVVEVQGHTGAGQGVSTDIIEAAARAYVRAVSIGVLRALETERGVGLPEPAA
jgi:2-isopropylmalate synthase